LITTREKAQAARLQDHSLSSSDPPFESAVPEGPPTLSIAEAVVFSRNVFGIGGRAQLLKSERDQNFLIDGDAGPCLLKITNPAEDRGVTNLQTAALLHVAAVDLGLPVPRLLPDRAGQNEHILTLADGRSCIARLLSFLPGVIAALVPPSAALRRSIGSTLARFDRALAGFSHPAESHELSWDIVHAAELRPLLAEIEDTGRRDRVEGVLDRFESTVAPALATLRWQVIHNDLSLFNILVDKDAPSQVAGVLDFGDMVRAPLIDELAIAASYHFSRDGDVLSPIVDLVRAYHETLALHPAEADLLYDLIATRQAATVLITESRARRHPENRDYILKNHPAAVLGLARLREIAREDAQGRFRRALNMEH
jgi:hydroxylysine kinase